MSELAAEVERLGRIAVLYGGQSAEREVSLNSGKAVLSALQDAGVDAIGIDAGADLIEQLREQNIKAAFIALHGAAGEDGRVQALLEFLNIPYTGSGVQACAIAMDKWRSKQVFEAMTVPSPAYEMLDENGNLESVVSRLGPHLMVKPACEGSSIGMSKVASLAELEVARSTAFGYDRHVFAEQVVDGAEYTVAVLAGEALPAIKLETDNEFYDFEAKYQRDDTRYLCPCGLSKTKEAELKSLALKAFSALGCSGWGRVDFMADEDGKFYVLEVNTAPGMTDHSLVPMAARAAGYNFSELVLRILAQLLPKS